MHRTTESPSTVQFEERALAQQVQQLVARLRPDVVVERRHDDRVAIPLLFRLMPLNSSSEPVCEDAVTIFGRDLSRRGLSFFHEHPLTYRRAIVSLEHPEFGRFAAEIDINWCRFTRPGWYESGGRLVRLADSKTRLTSAGVPVDSANWERLASLASGTCC